MGYSVFYVDKAHTKNTEALFFSGNTDEVI